MKASVNHIDPTPRPRWQACWVIVALVVILSACTKSGTTLTLVVPRMELDRAIAEQLVQLLKDNGSVNIELVPSPDPDTSEMMALQQGVADLALVSNNEPFSAQVATVAPLYSTVLHIAYRSTQAPFDLPQQLKEGTVWAGPPGSTSRSMLEIAAESFGVEQINYLKDGPCADVVVVFAPISPEVPRAIAQCGEYRMLSLGEPSDIGRGSTVDALTLMNPTLKPFVIPVRAYGDLTSQPIVTVAVEKLLVASATASAPSIFDLAEQIEYLRPALTALNPSAFQILAGSAEGSHSYTFMLHPGADAYSRRDEPDLLERYSGVAEVGVTLAFGVVSGVYAIATIYGRRRKNRIDHFYGGPRLARSGPTKHRSG